MARKSVKDVKAIEEIVASEIVKAATRNEISHVVIDKNASNAKKDDIKALLSKLPSNVWVSYDKEEFLKVGDAVVVEDVSPCKDGKKYSFKVGLRVRRFGKNGNEYTHLHRIFTNCGDEYKKGMALLVTFAGKQWSEPYVSSNEGIEKLATPFTSEDGKVTFEYLQHVRRGYKGTGLMFQEIKL